MGFTTTIKRKVEVAEKYPEVPVLTQMAITDKERGNTVFALNKEAMRLFGFALNTANVSKITVGYNDNQDLALAAVDLGNIYTSNITAKNTFSNKKLLERLVKVFEIEPTIDNEFVLLFDEPQADAPTVACMALILPDSDQFKYEDETPQIGSNMDDEGVIEAGVAEAAVEEIVEAPASEAPAHSMDDIPTTPSGAFEDKQAAFEADETTTLTSQSPHVIKVGNGVPVDAIVDATKEDW